MSITYLIAFDKKLNKTNFLYQNILPSKKFVFCEEDGIKFEEKLFPQEQDIAKKCFLGDVFIQFVQLFHLTVMKMI